MKLHLGYLLGAAAICLAACAGFFSIYGLSQLFAGATLSVIVMASALEISKLIIASYLHNYWENISKIMKTYLTAGVIILAFITSAGIYGYLSNAYQITANQLELLDGKVNVFDVKIDNYKKTIEANTKIIDSKSKRLDQLIDIRGKQENRLDLTTNLKSNTSMIKSTTSEIDKLNSEIDDLNNKNTLINDSISSLNTKKIELNSNSSVAGEVGPLKYMAKITGMEMDKIVNIFILLLVIVFDPLAISLVIATNSVFELNRIKKDKPTDKESKNEPSIERVVENDESIDNLTNNTILMNEIDEVIDVKDESKKLKNEELKIEKVELTKVEDDSIPKVIETQPNIEKTNKIRYEDIREVKEMKMNDSRNFSRNIPRNNHIGRI